MLTLRYSLTPPLTGESTAPFIAVPNCFTLDRLSVNDEVGAIRMALTPQVAHLCPLPTI